MSTAIKKFKYAEILSRVQRNFNLCLSDLLIYDIFFKIVATVIWGPAAAWLFNRLVATSGSLVIGNEQIITFIFSPVGLGAFVLSGGLALTIVFAEHLCRTGRINFNRFAVGSRREDDFFSGLLVDVKISG
jgi:membrane-anchored glycerophosphoryl diester phosphodiesterase (GDPDase)